MLIEYLYMSKWIIKAERIFDEWCFNQTLVKQLSSLRVAVCAFVLFFSAHSSCLSARFHAYWPAFLSWCMYICLPAFLSVPQVLWDCHKVLITHMTSPTSCLPCILGLSGLKNPFTRLPLFSPSSRSCPPLSSLLSSHFPGLSLWCFTAPLLYSVWIETADFWLLPESPSVWLQGFPDCA